MGVKFPFKKEKSPVLGIISRPIAKVHFWSKKGRYWLEVSMIIDSGADYTLLPRYYADDLKINLQKDCKVFTTIGIGGQEKVYFLPSIKIKLGKWKRKIPVGFLDRDQVPPLLGRHKFMEKFNTLFAKKSFIKFGL
mgnify:CR=1 FL=1